MRVVNRKLKDLRAFERNARIHSDDQVEQIAASITEFGFTNPVLIDESNGIIAGHGRVAAAQLLEMDRVPCVVLAGLSDEQKRAYVIADNKLSLNAGWDYELLTLEIEELADLSYDIGLLGFSEAELLQLHHTTDDDFDPQKEWKGMPEYQQKNLMAFKRLIVNFKNQDDVHEFAKLVAQKIGEKTRYIWFPEDEPQKDADKVYKSKK